MADALRLHESLSLDALVAEPTRARELNPEAALAMLAGATDQLAKLHAAVSVLAARTVAEPHDDEGESGMLTVDEAASLAGVSSESFRRRARFRPAVVRLGHRTLRVDAKRLRRILNRATGA